MNQQKEKIDEHERWERDCLAKAVFCAWSASMTPDKDYRVFLSALAVRARVGIVILASAIVIIEIAEISFAELGKVVFEKDARHDAGGYRHASGPLAEGLAG
jgi:hypothetical protein